MSYSFLTVLTRPSCCRGRRDPSPGPLRPQWELAGSTRHALGCRVRWPNVAGWPAGGGRFTYQTIDDP